MKRAEILGELRHPMVPGNILLKRRSLKRELLEQSNLQPLRVAILGGSTTSELKDMLEIFLLDGGIQPTIYQSGYNRYSEDVLFENPELINFKPDVVFLHTTWRNVSQFPELIDSEARVAQLAHDEVHRFKVLWEKIHSRLGALIIQNNFDLPRLRPLGNSEAFEAAGRINFLMRLNAEFASYARTHSCFLVSDIHYLSSYVGLSAWHADTYWYNFHTAVSPVATVALAQNVAAMIKAAYGRTKKCLVLDLDNTLWGGVVGDDGVQNLILGRDHAVGEAYLDFQRYVKDLGRRGVILAVCSKNDIENARAGFMHPDSILKLEDFGAFKANWNPKPENLREIAAELNIGLDSFVFVDDNPVERLLVAEQLPEVAVPEVGADVSRFAEFLEAEHYFDVNGIVQDDVDRAAYYSANTQRDSHQASFSDYGEFLASLEMTAEIAPFSSVYLERITQLINKTNQFNLTTRRYSAAEVETIAGDPHYVTLYGRLADRFGDNGLVSVLIGRIADKMLEIDLWVMSCRVLNREMELAMFDALVEQCQLRGINQIAGVYIPSKKNGIVAEHYPRLGFSAGEESLDGRRTWCFKMPLVPTTMARYIAGCSSSASTTRFESDAPPTVDSRLSCVAGQ